MGEERSKVTGQLKAISPATLTSLRFTSANKSLWKFQVLINLPYVNIDLPYFFSILFYFFKVFFF